VGFDEPKSLGKNETGGKVALPIWINYMEKALKQIPVATYTPPKGIVTAKINPATGLRETAGGMSEYFFQEHLPPVATVNDSDEDLLSNDDFWSQAF